MIMMNMIKKLSVLLNFHYTCSMKSVFYCISFSFNSFWIFQEVYG